MGYVFKSNRNQISTEQMQSFKIYVGVWWQRRCIHHSYNEEILVTHTNLSDSDKNQKIKVESMGLKVKFKFLGV